MDIASSPISVSVRDVVKEYASPSGILRVLDGVSFDVGGGQSLAIIGPSGSGKTTLLSIMGSLEKPTSGTVRIGGKAVESLEGEPLREYRAREVGLVFQEHRLLPQLTALENVLVPTLARGCAENRFRGMELLEMVGLAHRADALAWQMSGGERQRVAIGRALVNRPSLLLCDEPTGNLDRENALAVGQLLQRLAQETHTAVVIVTHNLELAAYCQRRIELVKGKVTL